MFWDVEILILQVIIMIGLVLENLNIRLIQEIALLWYQGMELWKGTKLSYGFARHPFQLERFGSTWKSVCSLRL